MELNILLTCGGNGVFPHLTSYKNSKKYKTRIVLADVEKLTGSLYSETVDKSYVIPKFTEKNYISTILTLIKKEKIDILYSGYDEEMILLSQNRDKIEALGCKMLLPTTQAMEKAFDKAKTFYALEKKVLMPQTYLYPDQKESLNFESLFEKLDGKCIIKPVLSPGGGRGISVPNTKEEYQKELKKIIDLNIPFMIQNLVQGDEYNVSTLNDLDSNLIYSFSRKKIEKRVIKSSTIAAVTCKDEAVIKVALDSLNYLGLEQGFNNVELIKEYSTNKIYLIEINGGRTAAQDANIVGAGVNFTDYMIDILLENKISELPSIEDGVVSLKVQVDLITTLDKIESMEVMI